jgi:uncharacterized protein
MIILAQFLVGLLLGLGLIVAGMADPAKVLNFLDIAAIRTGDWDASLAMVMAGAVAVTFFGYRITLRRSAPFLDDRFHLPHATAVDIRVIVGPAIFGVGWGLAGLCPGPAFTALLAGGLPAWQFLSTMIIGMAIARRAAASRYLPEPGRRRA